MTNGKVYNSGGGVLDRVAVIGLLDYVVAAKVNAAGTAAKGEHNGARESDYRITGEA